MTRKTLSDVITLADTVFGQIEYNLPDPCWLQYFIYEPQEPPFNNTDQITLALRITPIGSQGTPATATTVFWEMYNHNMTTSGLALFIARQEYNLHNRKIEGGEITLEMTNDLGSTLAFRMSLVISDKPIEEIST